MVFKSCSAVYTFGFLFNYNMKGNNMVKRSLAAKHFPLETIDLDMTSRD